MADNQFGQLSQVISQHGADLSALAGSLLSLAHKRLKPLAAIAAFAGGFVIAKIFGPGLRDYFGVTEPWVMPFGFVLGAFGWAAFGGLITLSERFKSDPLKTVKDVKDVM